MEISSLGMQRRAESAVWRQLSRANYSGRHQRLRVEGLVLTGPVAASSCRRTSRANLIPRLSRPTSCAHFAEKPVRCHACTTHLCIMLKQP